MIVQMFKINAQQHVVEHYIKANLGGIVNAAIHTKSELEAIGNRIRRKYSMTPSIITANFKDFDAKGRPPAAAKGAMSASSLTTETDIAFHSPAPVSFSGEGDA